MWLKKTTLEIIARVSESNQHKMTTDQLTKFQLQVKLVTFWIEWPGKLNPHLETLSSTDNEVITAETTGVMLLTILTLTGFHQVNTTNLQNQIWEKPSRGKQLWALMD